MPGGEKKVQQKMPMVNVALVGKLKEIILECKIVERTGITLEPTTLFSTSDSSCTLQVKGRKKSQFVPETPGKMFKINLSI